VIFLSLARESDELFPDLAPDGGRWIDDFKVICVLHRDELHVLTKCFLLFCVALAEFVRDVLVGSAVDENLLRTDVQFRGRRFAVVVWNPRRRSAKKTCDGIIAQVQLPGATQIEHARKRKHASDRRLMGSETQCKLAAGRVSGNAETVAIKRMKFILPAEKKAKSRANILKCSRPSATGIAHAAVLNIATRDSRQLESVAKMASVREVVFCAPVATVNEKHDRMWCWVSRDADIDKLIGIVAVGETQIGIRRLGGQNVFARHRHAV
jgi:hypothetical protein